MNDEMQTKGDQWENEIRSRMNDHLDRIIRRFRIIQERSNLVRQLDHTIIKSTDSANDVFKIIVDKGIKFTDSAHGQVVVIRNGKLIVDVSTEIDRFGQELSWDQSLCGKALQESKNQHYDDIRKIPSGEYVRFHKSTKSELALLIRSGQGARIHGILNLERTKLGFFDRFSLEFAELLATQAAIAIEQANIWRSVDELNQITTKLSLGELKPRKAYNLILDAVLLSLNFDKGNILWKVDNELVVIASTRPKDIGLRLTPNNSICGRYVLKENNTQTLHMGDISKTKYSSSYYPLLRNPEDPPMRSEMIVPLLLEGRVLGALNFESPNTSIFSEFEEKLLELVKGPVIRALNASLTGNTGANQDRIREGNIAMTYLGHTAQDFLHRFNNHIGHIRGSLDELRNHAHKHSVPDIRKGISVEKFLLELETDLKATIAVLGDFYEKFNPDNSQYQVQQIDFLQAVERAIRIFKKKMGSKNIKITYNNLIQGDPRHQCLCNLSALISDVIENLVINASEAISARRNRDGNFEGIITMSVDLPDALNVRLRITDNGIGIDEDDQKKVFDFSFSTKNRQGQKSGIGLWFCKLYTLQFGGEIDFRPAEPNGTTFEVILPTVLSERSD